MDMDDGRPKLKQASHRGFTRRQLLQGAGVLAALTGAGALVAACGGEKATTAANPTTAAPSTAAAKAPATLTAPAKPAVTAASTTAAAAKASTAAPGGTSVTVEAVESEGGYFFRVDKLAVPAGPVQFDFKNAGKITHELMVYPVQDLTELLQKNRADEDVDEMELIKDMVGAAEDIEPGKTGSFGGPLKPGFYELACHVRGQNPDGTTFVHFDKGQTNTLAVTGPGGPGPEVVEPAGVIKIEMKGDEAGSWLMVPDRLVATAGDVTFQLTNSMKAEHDLVVYPLRDISGFVTEVLGSDDENGGEADYAMIKGEMLIENLEPGKSAEKSMKLTPGIWAAACFMTSQDSAGNPFLHRDRGQRFTFVVK